METPAQDAFEYSKDGSSSSETCRPVGVTEDGYGVIIALSEAVEDAGVVSLKSGAKLYTKDGAEVDATAISDKSTGKAIFYNEDTQVWGFDEVKAKAAITAPSAVTNLCAAVADSNGIKVTDASGNTITEVRPGGTFKLVITVKTAITPAGSAKTAFAIKGSSDDKVTVTDVTVTSNKDAVKGTWTSDNDATNPTWSSGTPAAADDILSAGDVITITLKVDETLSAVDMTSTQALQITKGDFKA